MQIYNNMGIAISVGKGIQNGSEIRYECSVRSRSVGEVVEMNGKFFINGSGQPYNSMNAAVFNMRVRPAGVR